MWSTMRWRGRACRCRNSSWSRSRCGPGLVAALLVGVATAKGLAAAYELPLAARRSPARPRGCGFLGPEPFEPPFLSLIASGGHTLLARVTDPGPDYEVLGQTLDDAAGEAFDKGARLLGLGYPGGPALERLARDGDPHAFEFPTAERLAGLDFSFAGLKTALLYRVRDLGESRPNAGGPTWPPPISARSSSRWPSASSGRWPQTGLERLSIGGGVAANGPVRERHARARGRAARSAAGAVHRQRRDDRQRGPVRRRRCRTPSTSTSTSTRPASGCWSRDDRRSILYSREGCCLCDDAREMLERVQRGRPFTLEERDIDSDEALLRAYLERIPVVTIDGVEAFELFVDESELERRLDMVHSGMSYTVGTRSPRRPSLASTEPGEKLALGVAARLSRYLQVLIQARKMGKETISSQELADYTHVNSTQIRRDLSGFGKFGKRGVGYNVESLVTQIRKILRHLGPAQHRAVRRRPSRHRDRHLGHLRRPRLPRRRDVRRRPRQGRGPRSARCRSATTPICAR